MTDPFKKLLIILLCAFTFFVFYRPLEIEDNWWHLTAGRWMAEHQSVPRLDPFPVLEQSELKPWVLTQWLGSTVFYQIYALSGFEGLKLFRLVVFAVIIGIFIFYARRKIPWVLLIPLVFLLEYGIMGRVLLRPDIFNYIFIQIFLIVLLRHHSGGHTRILGWLLLTGILWSNVHLGSFVYGYFLVFLFLAADAVRWLALGTQEGGVSERAGLARNIRDLAVLFVLFPIVFFISPYGPEAGLYPFKVFFQPQFIHVYKFATLMEEALPPVYIFSLQGFWFYLLCLAVLFALFKNKKDRLLHIFLFVFPLFLFLKGGRGSAFFALTSVYVIAKSAADCGFLERWKTWRFTGPVSALLTGIMVLALTVQSVQGLTERIYSQGEYRKMYSVVLDPRLPDDAIRFLKSNKITGVVLANDNLGGYLLWSAYPALKPFVDGRQLYPDRFFKQVSALKQPHVYWPSLASEYGVKIVLLDLSLPVHYTLVYYLSRQPDWQLVYLQKENVIFVKRGAFALNEQAQGLESRLKTFRIGAEDMQRLSRIAASAEPSGLNGLLNPAPRYNEILEEATTLLGVGFHQAGISRMIEAFEVTGDASIPPRARLIIKEMGRSIPSVM